MAGYFFIWCGGKQVGLKTAAATHLQWSYGSDSRRRSSADTFSVLDYLGIGIASAGGALHARQHRRYAYDIVGAFGLALASGLGGGIARDVLLGHGPPLALVKVGYLYTALAGAAIALMFPSTFGVRMQRAMLLIDAAAISLFAVAGTTRAENFGLSWLPAIMLGITTAVGGGSLRDVLSGTTPKVFERGNFYAIVALVAAGSYLVLERFGLPEIACVSVAGVLGFALRVASVEFNWSTDRLRRK
jgi:uncharacterized membrane protein YeiH